MDEVKAQKQDTVVLAIVSERGTSSRVPTEYEQKLCIFMHQTDLALHLAFGTVELVSASNGPST